MANTIVVKTTDLDSTYEFRAETLGLEVANFSPEEGQLAFRLNDGFVIGFEAVDSAQRADVLTFIGLEVGSFEEVDEWSERLSPQATISRSTANPPEVVGLRMPSVHRDPATLRDHSPQHGYSPIRHVGNVRVSGKTLGWLVTRDGARHL